MGRSGVGNDNSRKGEEPNLMPEQRKSIWTKILEAWPLLMFALIVSGGGFTAWNNLEAKAAENTRTISSTIQDIERLRQLIMARASKFLTEQEIARLWIELNDASDNIDEMEKLIAALNLSDRDFSAALTLAVTKLESSIQQIAREQKVQSDAQSSLLQQILREVSDNN